MAREYDKLVRDEIPDLIEENGETPVVHTADEDEYEERLHDKLVEETAEFREQGAIEELADVLEVFHAICEHECVSKHRLEQLRSKKAEERGRFDRRIVLERVES